MSLPNHHSHFRSKEVKPNANLDDKSVVSCQESDSSDVATQTNITRTHSLNNRFYFCADDHISSRYINEKDNPSSQVNSQITTRITTTRANQSSLSNSSNSYRLDEYSSSRYTENQNNDDESMWIFFSSFDDQDLLIQKDCNDGCCSISSIHVNKCRELNNTCEEKKFVVMNHNASSDNSATETTGEMTSISSSINEKETVNNEESTKDDAYGWIDNRNRQCGDPIDPSNIVATQKASMQQQKQIRVEDADNDCSKMHISTAMTSFRVSNNDNENDNYQDHPCNNIASTSRMKNPNVVCHFNNRSNNHIPSLRKVRRELSFTQTPNNKNAGIEIELNDHCHTESSSEDHQPTTTKSNAKLRNYKRSQSAPTPFYKNDNNETKKMQTVPTSYDSFTAPFLCERIACNDAVIESFLQAEFAERTALEMKQLIDWWDHHISTPKPSTRDLLNISGSIKNSNNCGQRNNLNDQEANDCMGLCDYVIQRTISKPTRTNQNSVSQKNLCLSGNSLVILGPEEEDTTETEKKASMYFCPVPQISDHRDENEKQQFQWVLRNTNTQQGFEKISKSYSIEQSMIQGSVMSHSPPIISGASKYLIGGLDLEKSTSVEHLHMLAQEQAFRVDLICAVTIQWAQEVAQLTSYNHHPCFQSPVNEGDVLRLDEGMLNNQSPPLNVTRNDFLSPDQVHINLSLMVRKIIKAFFLTCFHQNILPTELLTQWIWLKKSMVTFFRHSFSQAIQVVTLSLIFTYIFHRPCQPSGNNRKHDPVMLMDLCIQENPSCKQFILEKMQSSYYSAYLQFSNQCLSPEMLSKFEIGDDTPLPKHQMLKLPMASKFYAESISVKENDQFFPRYLLGNFQQFALAT